MEVSTPKYNTLRILCPVTEGGTFKVFCHPSSSTVTYIRITRPLYRVCQENILQYGCFSDYRLYDRYI
jgi:hypothetical protein